MLNLSQLKTGVCKRIASTCTSSQTFLDLVNAAIRQLMQRGGWFATVQPMRFCLQSNCFVLPPFVESVLAVNLNGHRIDVANLWYDFEPLTPWHRHAAGLGYQFGGCCGGITAVSDAMTSVVGQVPPQSTNYLRFYVSHQNDYGKTIYVYGLDANGQKFISTFPDGTVQEGLPLVLVKPYVQSPLFSWVTRIVKPITAGVIRGYLYDPVSGLMNLLGEYQPNETLPQYVHMKLEGAHGASGNTISCLVKLKFIPVYNDNDIVLIDNEDAIRDMILSLREKEQGNIEGSMALEASALRELNHQMESRFPDEQFVARNLTFGETGELHRRIY